MTSKKHYIAMSGIMGCLPETCQSFDRFSDAVDFLVDLWDDHRGVRRQLKAFHIWYDEGNSLDYCEIDSCTCNEPAIHNDF
jgi:hypothetical protein